MAERFKKSGKEKLIVFLVTDLDPPGETIAQSFGRSMRDDFGIDPVAKKVAMTFDQVSKYKLPRGEKAKAGCSTRKAFVEKYGEHVYELEALDPAALQAIVRQAIDSVLDIDAFNRELAQEKQDAAELDLIRRRALAAIGQATEGQL